MEVSIYLIIFLRYSRLKRGMLSLANKTLRVDFHTHIIPEDFPDLAAKYGDARFPILEKTCDCGAEIFIQGKSFQKITDQAWDV